jgi:hypothetical protein
MSGWPARAVLSSALICVSLAPPVVHAQYLLDPPYTITDDRSLRVTASGGGQTVLLTWDDLTGVYFRVSNDQGLGFQPAKLVAAPPPENLDGLWLEYGSGSAPLMSNNGDISRVFTALELETDPFFPPPGLPPALHASFLRLYASGPFTSVFRFTHRVTPVSDVCLGPPGLACSGLRNLDAAMSDDAFVIGAAWTAFGYDGQDGDTWFARGEFGTQVFADAVNLTEQVLARSDGNDYDAKIAMSADGSRIFVVWTEIAPATNFRLIITGSVDGGATWYPARIVDAWYDNDVAYARSSGEVFVAYSTGYYFLAPPSEIQVIASSDDGATFSPPVTVAAIRELPDGTQMIPTYPVRVATTADGEIVAVLHTEEPCRPAGCGSAPFEIVLSVSEDGGASFQRVGTVARSDFAQSLTDTFDLQITDIGNLIFMTSHSDANDASIFRRAVRQ